MAIKNRITVGLKQILEVDANPMLSATPAPIGSHAMWQDGAVGKAYLKTGALDTDWLSYQTGSDAPAWNFAQNASELNDALAKSYFGTKSGDFDIEMQRNGEQVILMKATEIELYKDLRLVGSDRYIRSANSIHVETLGIISLASSGFYLRTDAKSYIRRLTIGGFGTDMTETTDAQRADILDATDLHDFNLLASVTNVNRLIEIRMFLQGLNGANQADVIVKKTLHIDRAGVMLLQDDFTSKNSFASAVIATVVIEGGQLKARLSGLSGLTSKIAKVEMRRLGSE